jgi:glucose/arabinose dehydrogenase
MSDGNPARQFVADQAGLVHAIGSDGVRSDPVLDVRDRTVSLGSGTTEKGLLGLALHPDFADNRRLFVRYSAPPREDGYVGPEDRKIPESVDHTFVLAEYRATEDGFRADLDSERVLLEIPEPQPNHNAGAIAFGPDDYLYVSVGDGGGANDTGTGHVEDWYEGNAGGNGQDVTRNLLGSILRIDVDHAVGGRRYGIPHDNPLVGSEGFDEHYAWGFRNPWRFSFDPASGGFFVADVGQDRFEEVNRVEKGGNYGWNVRTATHCFDASNPTDFPDDCPDSTPEDVRGGEPLRPPIIEYFHTYEGESVGVAVVGGYVYRGSEISDLSGAYVFGDWRKRLFVARPPDDGDGLWPTEELVVTGTESGDLGRFLQSFGRGPDGELYVLTSETRRPSGNGAVYRVVPPGEGDELG